MGRKHDRVCCETGLNDYFARGMKGQPGSIAAGTPKGHGSVESRDVRTSSEMTSRDKLKTESARQQFRKRLLSWYDRHRRDLPWRRNREPYRVWLSEIMLQQTRVAAVLEHYRRFLKRFPTVQKLAAAREASVLAAWSGLGYYRRARMLHAAAKQMIAEHDGKFPCGAGELRQLPGIGRYTAAAIASIAFDEPVAVVDGNVTRVLERVLGTPLAGEELWRKAGDLLDRRRPGDFNQAVMELGATVCLPKQPKCLACPVVELCASRGELKKRPGKSRQEKCEIHYALARRNGSVFLVQRPSDASLMPRMWELPEIEAGADGESSLTLRHSITVTDYTVRVREGSAPENAAGQWIARSRLNTMALTGLARKILRAARVI
jgi:A/G-specific adenine glycosylase